MFKPSVIFEVTDVCNLKCSFCYRRDRRAPSSVALPAFERVLARYRPFYLQITGGEPTLHPQFEELIRIALAKCLVVQFTSNGTLLARKVPFLASLKRKPIIALSLDSASALHDRIRGRKGLFRAISSAVAELQSSGIPVGLSTVVFGEGDVREIPKGNLREVPGLIALARELHVPINLQPFSPAREETRKGLGELLLGSDSPYVTNSPPFRKLLVSGHAGKCRYNLSNVSIGTDGKRLSTVPGDCYFCDDCRKCFYSCVWEPTLLASVHGLACAAHHLSTLAKLIRMRRAPPGSG